MKLTGKKEAIMTGFKMPDVDGWKDESNAPNNSFSSDEINKYRVTAEKDIPQPDPVIQIGEGTIATMGNLTVISAEAKAGKTGLIGVFIAGAISKTGEYDGFPDVTVCPNLDGKAVIHFDTEQAEYDQQKNIKRALRRNKFESTPDYFRSYNIRQLKLETYQQFTEDACDECSKLFNGVHLIVIDGGADYIASVNNEEDATNIRQFFEHVSIKYNCPVIVVVHLNPGSDKERGHFGSEMQRKCYALIKIEKKGDVSTASAKFTRAASFAEIPNVSFTFDKEKGYHVSCEGAGEQRNEVAYQRAKSIAKAAFMPLNSYLHKDAVPAIMKAAKLKDRAAKDMLQDMVGWGFVSHEDKYYRLAT
jgi:hypothetical protein